MVIAPKPIEIGKLGCTLIVSAIITTWCNLFFFRIPQVREIEVRSGGWITTTLLANLLLILLVLVLLLRCGFGVSFRDMGMRTEKWIEGTRDILLLMIGAPFLCLIIDWLGEQRLAFPSDADWHWWTQRMGDFVGQLFGNALYEEVLFRGVVFSQCIAWSRELRPSKNPIDASDADASGVTISGVTARVVGCAALISSLLFALQHLPNRLMKGTSPAQLMIELVALTLAGIFFALLYWRTNNLWTTIGFHAMANAPLAIGIASSWVHPFVMTLLGLYLLLRKSVR